MASAAPPPSRRPVGQWASGGHLLVPASEDCEHMVRELVAWPVEREGDLRRSPLASAGRRGGRERDLPCVRPVARPLASAGQGRSASRAILREASARMWASAGSSVGGCGIASGQWWLGLVVSAVGVLQLCEHICLCETRGLVSSHMQPFSLSQCWSSIWWFW